MVDRLFAETHPTPDMTVLDPGCGEGVFIEGVIRWCRREGASLPRIVGVEMHPERAANARERFSGDPSIQIVEGDFLGGERVEVDFVVGNPPYVSITQLSETEKRHYRAHFATASGRFDLYALFFERALDSLKPDGRLVFVTPQKYLSTASTRPLRILLASQAVREVLLMPEDVFPGVTSYPAVTVVDAVAPHGETRVERRDGTAGTVTFSPDGDPVNVAPFHGDTHSSVTLSDITDRISCGVATGADRVFVRPLETLPLNLLPFARPTISGRQLVPGKPPTASDVMLVPYRTDGSLIPEGKLAALGTDLREPSTRAALLKRTCVQRKPWYAFHETPPMQEVFRPKLLCKDIADRPRFWIDHDGSLLPRHSVYYIVPSDPAQLDALADVLNSNATSEWLVAHAQPAANGYRRLQSTVLKRIPIPLELATAHPALASESLLVQNESLPSDAWILLTTF